MNHKTDTFDKTGRQDRRKLKDRRKNIDRRSETERRHDFRENPKGPRKSLRNRLRSLLRARLGVDRRKGERRQGDRRRADKNDVLTPEEIAALLSPLNPPTS